MSKFIDHLFSEIIGRKYAREKVPSTLDMSYTTTEISCPPQIISYVFKAEWRLEASGTSDEYDKLHKIAKEALYRAIYGEFFDKVIELELALYDQDLKTAKKLLRELKEGMMT